MQNELLTMPLSELKERVALAERLALAATVAGAAPALVITTGAAVEIPVKQPETAKEPEDKPKPKRTVAPKEEVKTETPKEEAKASTKGGATEDELRQTVSDIIAKIRTDFSQDGIEAIRKTVSEYGYEKSKDVHSDQLTDFINDLNLVHSSLGKKNDADSDMDV